MSDISPDKLEELKALQLAAAREDVDERSAWQEFSNALQAAAPELLEAVGRVEELEASVERWHKNTLEEQGRAIKAEAERDALREALELIRLTDWGWTGGGSDVRHPGRSSLIASKALGVPSKLPDGWPDESERDFTAHAARALEGSR